MDKETLSNYGWIVICTLVLVVMIALSTPFGTYVASAVKTTTEGLFSSSASAMDTVLTEMGAEPVGRPDGIKFETANGTVGGSESIATTPGATFDKIMNCQHHEDCEYGWHEDDCYQSCEPVTLTWEELKDTANGEKYGYLASSISDTSIGEDAFYWCDSLTSIAIPNSVTSIGNSTFYCCSSLTSVTIPNSITSIGKNVFCNCTSLTSITIPNSVTSIGEYAFEYCSSLTSVTIPNSVTSISEAAFIRCLSLTSITIPNSITSIAYHAFKDCTSLTSVTIPNSATSISGGAFYGCTSLTDINYQGTKTQWNAITKDNFWNAGIGNYTIHCTDGNIPKS